MLDFNLEYYRAFYYVAELQSITKAAQALFLTQPALTASIKKLEEHFSCKLFLRTSKGMRLTAEGEILFRHVSRAFDTLMEGETELDRAINFAHSQLAVGATETALYYYLLPKVERFREDNQNINLHITGSSTPEMISMLHEGTIDLAVAVSPIPEVSGLATVQVRDFEDVVIAGSRYRDLKNRVLTPAQLATYPLVTVEKNTSARRHIDNWFEENGIILQPEYTVRTSTAILPFVERNLAIGIVPNLFIDELVQKGSIFQVRLSQRIRSRQITILYKPGASVSRLCQKFIDFLLEPAGP